MFPPSTPGGVSHIDLSALSGISGSISIACWVVVFSPQIIENFRRQSADGLSVTFLVIWLLGDLFNIIGAIMQGVLPTMIILAVYYTLADIVLLVQVWYYRGFTFRDADHVNKSDQNGTTVTTTTSTSDNERRPLLQQNGHGNGNGNGNTPATRATTTNSTPNLQEPDNIRRSTGQQQGERSASFSASIRRHLSQDGTHLSPATPLLQNPKPNDPPTSILNIKKLTTFQSFLFNTFAVLLVCAAGILGWWISTRSTNPTKPPPPPFSFSFSPPTHHKHNPNIEDILKFDILGQVFGYLCAAFYLGSRIPQLLLNHKRKSTEGVSLLFFLFACLGNLTYDMSIFAYDPSVHCVHGPLRCRGDEAGRIYARYIAVNASWIAGSLGTLVLDFAIFVQFFLYRKEEGGSDSDSDLDGGFGDEVAVSG